VELERAIEVLNRKKHDGSEAWNLSRYGDGDPHYVFRDSEDEGTGDGLFPEDAIAIAEEYEATDPARLAADLAAARGRIAALEGEREWLLNYGNEWLCDRYCYTRPEHIEAGRQEILAEMAAALAPAGREGEVAS
jgi:hypothetical protein